MGDFSIHQIESGILGRKRKLRVYTPSGIRPGKGAAPPLLLQQDGQLAFTSRDEQLRFGSWGLDEWIERLAGTHGFDAPVAVGIDTSPKRRQEYFPMTPEFDLYESFILEEVLPWTGETLGFPADPARTMLMGSSMGGIASFGLLFRNPDRFAGAACLSPWFEFEKNRYVREVLRPMEHKPPVRVYMDSGLRDWRQLDDGHRGMLLARLELLRLGFREGEDFDWTVDTHFPTVEGLKDSLVKPEFRETATWNQHTEHHWRRRLERPLRFLFGKGT